MNTHNMNDEMLRGRGTSYFFAGVITCNFTDIFSFSLSFFSFFPILRKKRSRKCKKKSREVNEWRAFLLDYWINEDFFFAYSECYRSSCFINDVRYFMMSEIKKNFNPSSSACNEERN